MSESTLLNTSTARPRQRRIAGLDAARGLALVGMIAIHVLPAYNEEFAPTLTWRIAAGTSAALFAFLAGVGLSISTSRGRDSGAELRAARASLLMRGVMIAGIGLVLGQFDVPAAIILSYYGVMFALAVPLLGRGPRVLFGYALLFATLGAFATQRFGVAVPNLGESDPSVSLLFSDPGGTLGSLFLAGSFPALAWMSYICAGMAVGRLDLRSFDVQLRLMLAGASTALLTFVASAILLGPLGIKQVLVRTSRGWMDAEEVQDVLIWGPLNDTPLESAWWQVNLSPYSNSSFELLNTLGVALAVFGALLWLGSKAEWLLVPLGKVGSMTLSLYAGHLLVLATGLGSEAPYLTFWIHCAAALLMAVLWRNITALQRGPLEHLVALGADRIKERSLARSQTHG